MLRSVKVLLRSRTACDVLSAGMPGWRPPRILFSNVKRSLCKSGVTRFLYHAGRSLCADLRMRTGAGQNGLQDDDDGHASPTRLPEQPDGFIEPRNISRLAETVVKVQRLQTQDRASTVSLSLALMLHDTDSSGSVRCLRPSVRVKEFEPKLSADVEPFAAQVFCVHSEPNYSLPWQRKRQFSSTGSGFIIPGRRILTNAHCVDHHSQVKVRRRGSDTKVRLRLCPVGSEHTKNSSTLIHPQSMIISPDPNFGLPGVSKAA